MIRGARWWMSSTPAYPPRLQPVPSEGIAPAVSTTRPAPSPTLVHHLASTGFDAALWIPVGIGLCIVGMLVLLAIAASMGRRHTPGDHR